VHRGSIGREEGAPGAAGWCARCGELGVVPASVVYRIE
jgi:hypothetical protein